MHKKFGKYIGVALLAGLLVGCGNEAASSETAASNTDGTIKLDTLSVGFVPSRDPEEIVTATEPLKELLIDEMANQGYDIGEVDITVGTNYEAVGESLSAGTLDVGFIPGGTYVLYDDGAEVILTSTRAGLSIDSDNPADWNENAPTEPTDEQVTSYRSLIIAGPSEKGQELAAKINSGEELTFEDMNSASWSVMSSSSSAGYIYPTLWLNENFGKSITDLDKVVQADSYGSSFARLASEQVDLLVTFADGRRDYEDTWTSEYGRTENIWDETTVVGVTPGIYNDTISVSKNSDKMDEELKSALQEAFINISKTDEGKEVISVYSHEGYQVTKDADYDDERAAQKIVQDLGIQ